MLLRIHKRRARDEEGAALVTVVALVAIAAVITLAVSASVFSANRITTSTRAGVQSEASAQAGIDYVLGEFNKGNYLCKKDMLTVDPAFSVTVSYTDGSATLPCSTVVSGSPKTATILSIGYPLNPATSKPIASSKQQMGATVTITPPSAGPVLDRALFTENDFTLTNNTTVSQSAAGALDGDVYTNGALTCATQNVIEGMVVTRGSVNVANPCKVLEAMWTGGDFTMASSGNVTGDVYAVGLASLGSGHVGGSVIANGAVSTTTPSTLTCPGGSAANVCGSVYSLNGAVQFQNDTLVGGGVYARNNITLGTGGTSPRGNLVSLKGALTANGQVVGGTARVYGAVSGSSLVASRTCSVTTSSASKCSGTLVLPFPSATKATFTPAGSSDLGTASSTVLVAAPARQAFPQIASSSTAIAQNWASWTKKVVPANDPLCSSSNSSFTTAFAPLLAAGGKLLVQFQCTKPVALGNDTLSLKGDVAFMTPYGFSSQNNFTVKSSDSKPHSLYLIVPSDAPGVSWSAADSAYPGQLKPTCLSSDQSRDITINSLSVSDGNQIFMYSPCTVSIPNAPSATFSGQIYAGYANYGAGIRITRATMSVPGVTFPGSPAPTTKATITLNSRYDIR